MPIHAPFGFFGAHFSTIMSLIVLTPKRTILWLNHVTFVTSTMVDYHPVQRVMNAAACVIMNLSISDHVKPALKELIVYQLNRELHTCSCT